VEKVREEAEKRLRKCRSALEDLRRFL